jgi:peptidoglycan/xylan/chitin deacetylase (PgdA/CDA1 family)
MPFRLPGAYRPYSGRTVAEGPIRLNFVSAEVRLRFEEWTGVEAESFPLATRVFEFKSEDADEIIARTVEGGLPLIVRRNGEVIVNFDVPATQAFEFADSTRPFYTYLPAFNIQAIPPFVRRPLSNTLAGLRFRMNGSGGRNYARLPLTNFEFAVFALSAVLVESSPDPPQVYRWPGGKRAAFLSTHDVDTASLLRRRENDPLFRIEQKHKITSTWFIPTAVMNGRGAVDFLLGSGQEVGWHGHKHDHRLPYRPFTEQSVEVLNQSFLAEPANFPTGMRSPRLLKSNRLFEVLERDCPAMSYDTSFLQGIAPYYLWLKQRASRILEIPMTVPSDIRIYNELQGIKGPARFRAMLEAQITRTKQLVRAGGLVSIVTHPEKDLSERPELLDIYDDYLAFVTSCPDIHLTTAGQLYCHWTGQLST